MHKITRSTFQRWVAGYSVQNLRSMSSAPEFILKSRFPEIPNCAGITIPEHLASFEKPSWKTSIAYECGITGARISHRDVFRNGKSFASALQNAGLQQRDVVSIILPNNIHYASILLGVMEAGLIASPVNPSYTPTEMLRQVDESESNCIVTIPEFVPALRTIQKSSQKMKLIVVGEATDGCHTYSEMIKTDHGRTNFLRGSQVNTAEEIALLPFSSGTTGLPKGVCLTHLNMVINMKQVMTPGCLNFNPAEEDRFIGLLPFFHAYGLMTFMFVGLSAGASTMCLPKFDPVTFLKAVRQHKPTILHLVTPLIALLAASPDYGPQELGPVHTIVGGGAPIGPALIQKLANKAKHSFFFQEVYGLTELSPGATVLSADSKNTKIGSCGRLIPSTFGKIVATDGTGQTLGPNQRGEICIKGPQVMKGYWKNETATNDTIDKDGWLHTGDIGYYDEEDYFYIVDRLKELIKVKGFQVAPAELEALLCQHPMVADAAVIGIPDEQSGELPRAYIVTKDPKITSEDIHDFLKDKVSHFKELKGGIEFVTSIPKAPSGKILRRVLKDEYTEKHGNSSS